MKPTRSDMIPNTKEGENCSYAIVYWYMSELMGEKGKRLFPKAEEAAEDAIRYLAQHLPHDKALSYIQTFGLYRSKFWQSLSKGGGE